MLDTQEVSSAPAAPAPPAAAQAASQSPVMDSAQGQKPKRKKASRACSHCQKAHLTCDDARPCGRCVKKGLAATCTDGQRKKAKYLLEEDELQERRASEERANAVAAARAAQELQAAELAVASQETPSATALTAATVAGPDASMEDAAGVLFQPSAGLPSYTGTGTGSFDSPASAATGPSGGGGDGTYVSMLDSDPAFNTSFHPFGTENASLEYSMLSSMIYGSGIDPSLLGAGLDDLGLSQASFYNEAPGPSPGTGLQMGTSMGPGMYDGTSGGAGIGNVMYDGTSGGAGVGTGVGVVGVSNPAWPATMQAPDTSGMGSVGQPGLYDPVLAPPPMTSMTSPSLAVNNAFPTGPDPMVLGGAQPQPPLPVHPAVPIAPTAPPAMLPPLPSMPAHSQPLALQKFAHPSSQRSPDPNVTLNQLLRLRPEEEDWDTRIRRVHTERMEPFHYTDGYHFLINYVTANYERDEALRVVRALAIIRPSLIALQMPLSEEDEIFVERSIQRMALEFEKLIAFSGTPTVVWRRTCEICVVGTEFSMLTHWPREELIGKHIYQFLDKKSTIEYWEKFAMHAFENTSQSVVTRCVLLTPQGKPVPCSACFSIKRDMFDLPSLIVGNFLPIL
ncbi:Transcriptional regulator of nonfermentable carbon utilization [Tilletia horrida]|nr:Transcriptional regulator of nonfermentable carbon utilization [Tilletia horrida]